ncbi:hypothetical protein [Bartonella queenslandensis]|uniref:hypothetical protein n=1 Tax=Bartonella queenslandensis TaxID=481138 RepID=UPI001BA83AD3|nr:hypothetical protein [Bartonella queenslandensis]
MVEYWAFLGGMIIAILMFMVMIRLPYLLIKHMRLSFKLAQELKKRTTQQKQAIQQLCNDQGEMKRQNLTHKTLDAKVCFLNFKESLPLYAKEGKIILFVFILIYLLQFAFSIANLVWWKGYMIDFIMPPLLGIRMLIWLGIFLLFPIIGLMCIKLTRKLRETLQQLEVAIKQRDQAIRMQNVQGEQNDE